MNPDILTNPAAPVSPLLDALAAATTGSRELDARVAEACGWKQATGEYWRPPPHFQVVVLLHFTTSHDAARTLLLPDWRVRCMFQAYADGPCDVELADLGTVLHSNHRDPILAICIAALKARGIGGGV